MAREGWQVSAAGQPAYLTTKEVADLLRVKERKVYDLAAAGEIPHRRITGKLLFPHTEIIAWIEGSGSVATAARSRSPMRCLPAVLSGSPSCGASGGASLHQRSSRLRRTAKRRRRSAAVSRMTENSQVRNEDRPP